jgi:membrane-associated protein
LTIVDPLSVGAEWLDPDTLIRAFGALAVLGVAAIVFAETGLLVGFFLPGDSLLFTAGLLISTGVVRTPLPVMITAIAVAAIMGDQLGYGIGRRAGPAVFARPRARWLKPEYVERTAGFFERYGGRTIVLARFVPIVRTFAPVVAGIAPMRYRTFFLYNVAGGLLWAIGVTALGYWLGQFGFIRHNIELIFVGIVLVSVQPIVVEVVRTRRRHRRTALTADPAPDDGEPAA